MTTLPIEPIIDSESFKKADPTLKLATLELLLFWGRNHYKELPKESQLRKIVHVCDKTWYKRKDEITELFQEIAVNILKRKAVCFRMRAPALAAIIAKGKKRRELQGSKPLADTIGQVNAPLIPQKSVDANILRKERIVSQEHYTRLLQSPVIKPTPGDKPPLK